MEDIEKELEAKQIEKSEVQTTIVDAEEKPKVKKPRSEAQIKAFEKARAKRMENLKKKEEQAEQSEQIVSPDPQLAVEDKSVSFVDTPTPTGAIVEEKPKPKRGRGRPKGVKNKKVMKHQEPPPTPDRPYYPHPVEHNIPQAIPPQYPIQGQVPLNPYQQYQYYQPPPQPQAPVNNYYYYGTPPPPRQEKKEEEFEIIEDSSGEEEEVVEEQYPQYQEPTLRYRFV